MSESQSDQKLLKIGELAALGGISVKAMHVYEEKNIIRPAYVDEATGYRYYRASQLTELESLLGLQDLGFSLNEISEILSGTISKEDVSALFEQKKNALQESLWKI